MTWQMPCGELCGQELACLACEGEEAEAQPGKA